jgi:hypothetical protein
MVTGVGTAVRVAKVADHQNDILNTNKVYRALAKGEDPTQGLVARSIRSHRVSPLSHVAGKRKSPWISTTKDFNIAMGKYNNKGYGVVEIDLNKIRSEIVDLSQGIPKGGRFSNYAKADQEVLIKYSIPADAITRFIE